MAVLRGAYDDTIIALAAGVMAHHTKFRNEPFLSVDYWDGDLSERKTIVIKPAATYEVEKIRL